MTTGGWSIDAPDRGAFGMTGVVPASENRGTTQDSRLHGRAAAVLSRAHDRSHSPAPAFGAHRFKARPRPQQAALPPGADRRSPHPRRNRRGDHPFRCRKALRRRTGRARARPGHPPAARPRHDSNEVRPSRQPRDRAARSGRVSAACRPLGGTTRPPPDRSAPALCGRGLRAQPSPVAGGAGDEPDRHFSSCTNRPRPSRTQPTT